MNRKPEKEIKQIIDKLELNCTIKEFKNVVDWDFISECQKLSENFIRGFKDEVHWFNISRCQTLSENFIREFKNKVCWTYISKFQILSENFIREFKDEVYWTYVSYYQKLSENFIREFKNKVCWTYVSRFQILSENFIREFKDEVEWFNISQYQKLSENFIREFKDKVEWEEVFISQTLSENFIKEFKDEVNIELYNKSHQIKTIEEKEKEMQDYAKEYNLEFDGKYLYAFRNHDRNGCGIFNKTIKYKKGQYYKDWHCNMNKNEINSFGLGIFPKGNTKVKVKIEDWGVCVNREDGKCRVWGFEIV